MQFQNVQNNYSTNNAKSYVRSQKELNFRTWLSLLKTDLVMYQEETWLDVWLELGLLKRNLQF